MSVTSSGSSILPPVGVKFTGPGRSFLADAGNQLCKAAAAGNKRLLKKFLIEKGVREEFVPNHY